MLGGVNKEEGRKENIYHDNKGLYRKLGGFYLNFFIYMYKFIWTLCV